MPAAATPLAMRDRVRVVVATRESRVRFFETTATGRSLALYRFPFLELMLFEQNRTGLPALYNRAIEAARERPAILVFVHDDVHLCDFYWPWHLASALASFDVVGLAGNRRRLPNQPSWAFVDTRCTWDAQENLSGIVGHGQGFPPAALSVFGNPRQEVKLLDGVLVACRSTTLIDHDVRFDERFDFHFYDLDLCRQAEARKLTMGTWPISVVHESGGDFGSPAWHEAYAKYLQKWGA